VRRLVARRQLPQPTYVLDERIWMLPADYFRLADEAGGAELLEEHFRGRYEAAGGRADALDDEWDAYLGGGYGVCLREVTPENIVRKGALVAELCELLVLARPRSASWRRTLRARVDELDALEREFAPDFDRRAELDLPPTRDLLIDDPRRRFPEVFAGAE
jgi:hypothetical protein